LKVFVDGKLDGLFIRHRTAFLNAVVSAGAIEWADQPKVPMATCPRPSNAGIKRLGRRSGRHPQIGQDGALPVFGWQLVVDAVGRELVSVFPVFRGNTGTIHAP
jgi:hypothetical protein